MIPAERRIVVVVTLGNESAETPNFDQPKAQAKE
jgi:hypothetical protein